MIVEATVTILVSDLDRALHFYTKVLGLALRKQFGAKYAEVEVRGFVLGLHLVEGDASGANVTGNLSVGFRVEDIVAEVAWLGERGLIFSSSIEENQGGKFAYFQDPDGTPLYIWQSKAH
jgi:catechol 2,3-dioxygenase-like lactoylglutathione lyase family enzyme